MSQKQSTWKVLTRRKVLAAEGMDCDTKLNRVLNLYDLTALGVGSTLGAGVYVLAGQIAKEQAGPSVMLSFAIAALASLLAGICYAEFGARVPKAGSAYVYSYVCIGEFAAFVIGWNLMLEYMIGTAAVCRGISLYMDTLINDTLKTTFAAVAPIEVSFFGSYFDFFAFGLVVLFGVPLAFGVETSTMANNFCTCLNLSILLFVIIAGAIKANFDNWNIDVTTVNATNVDLGEGGFFPFGFEGTLRGAATCFFGFVGFDCIATTGEEVRNPRKNIPRSILLSLLIIFLCYFGVSTVLTLMVPYYLQDPNAPLPYAFKAVGWTFAMWVVAIGGLTGLLASLFGALFPLPRVMYSMAEDGLLFRFLGKISPRFQVPVIGSIFAAFLTALMAGLFDLAQLVSLLSIGTLLAYSVVAISITILRYMDNSEESDRENGNQPMSETTRLTSEGTRITCCDVLMQLFNCRCISTPTPLSTVIVGTLITLFCLLSVGIGLILMEAHDALVHNQLWVLALLSVLLMLSALVLFAICVQPRETYTRFFRVPFVPVVPALSIFINIYLMLQLNIMTWVRFAIWMVIGVPMYIACWCGNDVRNRHRRNPRYAAFARALQGSAHGRESPNGLGLDQLESNSDQVAVRFPNGITVFSSRSERLSSSFDDNVSFEEVDEELVEVRRPNGKIFFIEDGRSNMSLANYGCGTERLGLAYFNDPSEDEQSVFVTLDDVLGTNDELAIPSCSAVLMARHKASLDLQKEAKAAAEASRTTSKATTTVATIQSSSDSSDKEFEDSDSNGSVCSSDRSLKLVQNRYKKAHKAARNFVENMLTSDRLWSTLELNIQLHRSSLAQAITDGQDAADIAGGQELQRAIEANREQIVNATAEPNQNAQKDEESNEEEVVMRKKVVMVPWVQKVEKEPKKQDDSLKVDNEKQESAALDDEVVVKRRRGSTGSIVSVQDEPLHSEKFKNKLSQLIMRPPSMVAKVTKEAKPKENGGDAVVEGGSLKQSKSETDIRQLVLAALEGTGRSLDENGVAQEVSCEGEGSAGAGSKEAVPKPPKFDPVLYKTINSHGMHKVRPGLVNLEPELEQKPKISAKTADAPADFMPLPKMPFKSKLEAILKRGPAHSLHQPQEPVMRRPKSQGAALFSTELDPIITLTTKSEGNLNESANGTDDASFTLRPMAENAAGR